MVFALHKIRHYLLGNKFVFYVDNMALIYLVNKPQVLGVKVRWLLLFLVEYDFIVVYKPNGTHVVIDSLSRLLDIIEPTSVLDQAINAIFFNVESKWLKDVKEFLKIGQIESILLVQQKQRLVRRAKPFTLKNDELYRMG